MTVWTLSSRPCRSAPCLRTKSSSGARRCSTTTGWASPPTSHFSRCATVARPARDGRPPHRTPLQPCRVAAQHSPSAPGAILTYAPTGIVGSSFADVPEGHLQDSLLHGVIVKLSCCRFGWRWWHLRPPRLDALVSLAVAAPHGLRLARLLRRALPLRLSFCRCKTCRLDVSVGGRGVDAEGLADLRI